jgi:hypothetical protein
LAGLRTTGEGPPDDVLMPSAGRGGGGRPAPTGPAPNGGKVKTVFFSERIKMLKIIQNLIDDAC